MASIYWFVVLVTILVTTVESESPVQCSGCIYDETCFTEGETHRNGTECVTRKCEVVQLNTTHYQISMKIIDQDCPYNGECVKEGETRDGDNCGILKCLVDKEAHSTQMEIYEINCPYNGECVKEGETRDGDNCGILKCLVDKEAHSTKMEIYEIRCKDNINETCHTAGKVMMYNFGGTLYKCNCEVSGNSAKINNCVSP